MSDSTNTKNNATQRVVDWLDERYNISPLIDYMKHKEVPIHRHTVWYYMGGVSLFLFIVQVVTGILLVLYYRPGAESAF
ncbi:MAG: cytochrome B, partial [Candidatus Krumholzibacteria bacterium]|nr:cytochrome B [Candidatus Krumholzibacteria bacterium]